MNPYDPPLAPLPDQVMQEQPEDAVPSRSRFIVWPIVFALNLIVPLLFGGQLVRENGMIGLSVAVGFFLIAGWYVCYASPAVARRLLVGSSITAITQLFPVIQLIAGILALGAVSTLGLSVDDGDLGIGQISNDAGAFLATMITGSIIAAVAMLFGLTGVFVGGGIKRTWTRRHGM